MSATLHHSNVTNRSHHPMTHKLTAEQIASIEHKAYALEYSEIDQAMSAIFQLLDHIEALNAEVWK